MKLHEAWSEVLIQNEKAKKTDEALRKEMQKRFPDKKDKTTITRVSMIRSIYNRGTNLFAKYGPAGTKGRPVSKSYGPNGEIAVREPKAKAKAVKPKAKVEAPAPVSKFKLVLKKKTA